MNIYCTSRPADRHGDNITCYDCCRLLVARIRVGYLEALELRANRGDADAAQLLADTKVAVPKVYIAAVGEVIATSQGTRESHEALDRADDIERQARIAASFFVAREPVDEEAYAAAMDRIHAAYSGVYA